MLENIPDISVTLDVLKLLKSSCVKFCKFANIPHISVTFDAVKLLPKVKVVNPEQLLNILFIFVTFDVSKLLTSKVVKLEQP